MKGVSTVIATILMLMITIALAGMAYIYISGVLTGTAGKTIRLVDVTCTSGGDVSYVVKNVDPKATLDTATELVFFWDGVVQTVSCNPNSVTSYGITTCTVNVGAIDTTKPHTGKVAGPVNSEERSIYCG